MHFIAKASAAAVLIGLSGCVATLNPVDVTRFHVGEQGQSIERGTIMVVAGPSADAQTLEFRSFASAVGRALQGAGYQEVRSDADAVFIAQTSFDRSIRPAGAKRSPVSVGVGGSTGRYGGGLGVGIGINLSGKPKDIVDTELKVAIRRKADNAIIWEGRAVLEAKQGTAGAQPGLVAAKLADTLFRGFPGPSGRTIRVK